MPREAFTHQECRLKVCLVCFQKGAGMKAVGPVLLGRKRQFYIENYDQSVIQLPGAICGRCRNLLLKVERGEKALEDLPEPYDFSKILLTAITSPTCKCVLCEIARENTVGWS
ncbi:hypothetical protein SNE40_018309 [Patella caerulea]|uniref:Uncharacterized protein n=1 Tax=Patella caerulea TaxID=87958 RepID=A0AAN8J7F5_PATCE